MGRFDGWRFCPRCGASLATARGRVDCGACGFVAWANASVSASALIEDGDGRILLGRRAREPQPGLWDIPGGFLEEDEGPLVALVREVREETGLRVVPGEFVGCWLDTYAQPGAGQLSTLNLFWRVRFMDGGNPVAADDVAELAWFARGALPPRAELAFDCVAQALDAWKALSPG